ncbi:MAG: PEP-utilizing enzyme [Patescibacteria group bacterium]|jgi:phosphohistidine swiveling domain-containing protein
MNNNYKYWQTITYSGTHHPILFIDTVFRGYQNGIIGKFFNIRFNPSHYRQFNGARWWLSEEVDKYICTLKNKKEKSPGTLLKKANEYYQLNKNFLAWAEKNRKINFKGLTNQKILHAFRQCVDQLATINALVYTAVFLDKFYTDDIIEIVNTKTTDPIAQRHILTVIFSVPWGLESHLEKVSLLRLVQKKRDKISEEKLKRLINSYRLRFGSVFMMPFQSNPLSITTVLQKVNMLARNEKKYNLLKSEIKELQDTGKKFSKICKSLKLSTEEKREIDTLRRWTFVANNDDPYVMKSLNLLQPLWDELARRLNLTFEQLIELQIHEVEKFIVTGVSAELRQELKLRKNAALVWDHLGTHLFTGQKLKSYINKQGATKKIKQINAVKGLSASPGKARGRVFILHSIYDIPKIKKGAILLAPYTYPAIVAAMRKASAIVTDQGGLLSHAAIISREMKKPCIVGTNVATRIFQDGDLVEVDADNGIIKLLKKRDKEP